MYKILSYKLNENSPVWPGSPKVSIKQMGKFKDGKGFNMCNVTMFNHFGSHMDAPKHFREEGLSIAELPLERFIYNKPLLVNIPKNFVEMVTAEDLKNFELQIADADLLMIKSGFSIYREKAPERYAKEGPGVSSGACKYLIENFPNLKSIALDWISLSSYPNDDGMLAHEYMLGKFSDNYICIIEDINLDGLSSDDNIKKVFSLPLFIEGIDSSPVTVIAEVD